MAASDLPASQGSSSSGRRASQSPTGRCAGSHSERARVFHHLVHMGIPAWEKAIRTIAVYLAILFLFHFMGKRAALQLNAFDLVILLLLSNVVQNAIIGDDLSITGGILGAAILVAMNYVLVRATY